MLDIKLGLMAQFTVRKGKISKKGHKLKSKLITEFNNLILNTGLERIGLNGDYMNYLHLGSGISLPTPVQSSLQNTTYTGNSLAPGIHTTAGNNVSDLTAPFTWIKRTFRVNPRGTNNTYSEIGVGWNTVSLFSRTLIKDPNGNPTTITVLSDEYLDVTYELRMYIPTHDTVVEVVPTGDDTLTRTITTRASNIGNFGVGSSSWGLATSASNGGTVGIVSAYSSNYHCIPYTGKIQGITSNPNGATVGSWFNYSIERLNDTSIKCSISRLLPDNVGIWSSLILSTACTSFQTELDPPFVKTNEDKFDMSYTLSWGRYTPTP